MSSLLLLATLCLGALLADGAQSSARADSYMLPTLSCGSSCSDSTPITVLLYDKLPAVEVCVAAGFLCDVVGPVDPATGPMIVCYDIYLDDPTALKSATNRIANNVCVKWNFLYANNDGTYVGRVPAGATTTAALGMVAAGNHTLSYRRLWVPKLFTTPPWDYVTTFPLTVARNPTPTATSLIASQQGATVNDYVVSATIQGIDTNTFPLDGTVTFLADGQAICTLAVGPTCPMNLAKGVHRLQVQYSGNLSNLPSNSSVIEIAVGIEPQVIVTGGKTQSTAIGTALAAPLEVKVIDGLGKPYPGIQVNFGPTSAGFQAPAAILSDNIQTPLFSSVITDAAGVARVTATANGFAGTYTYAAAVTGFSSQPTFQLTNYGAPASITATSGATQSGNIGTRYAQALGVTVKDAKGNPVPNVTVTFSGPSSGATAYLDAITLATDANGKASVKANANGNIGSFTLNASVAGVAAPAAFALTNTLGPSDAATLEIFSGNNQRTSINTAFAQPLRVRVLNKAGNPIANYPISFDRSAGASAFLDNGFPVTNAAGIATVNAKANGSIGLYQITAVAGVNVPAVNFTAINLGPPYAINAVSGTPQSAYLGAAFAQDLVFKVTDSAGNALSGIAVTMSGPGSGATANLDLINVTTGADGTAQVKATATTTLGSYTLTANVAGLSPASFALSNIYAPAFAPASISIVDGNNQKPKISTAFATPLKVQVLDPSSRPVSGVSVTFSATAGASAIFDNATPTTDANGFAITNATANTSVGNYTFTASVSGVAIAATFSATNLGPPYAIGIVSGDNQTALVGRRFDQDLVFQVTDSAGAPLSGVDVALSTVDNITGASAFLFNSHLLTGADGRISAKAAANSYPGAYKVVASVAGVATPANLALNNVPPTGLNTKPKTFSLVSGDAQTQNVNAPFATPIKLKLVDELDRPMAGFVVNFEVSAGANASFDDPNPVTDANGIATTNATANATAGPYEIRASLNVAGMNSSWAYDPLTGAFSGLRPIRLTATNIGPPAIVSVVSGNNQSAYLSAAFAQDLVFKVTDSAGAPLSGIAVTMSGPGSGPTADLDNITVTTGPDGTGRVKATARSTPGSYTLTANVTALAPAIFALTNVPLPAPTITAITPVTGPTLGGTVVTITGTNFTNTSTVKFGANAATAVVFNSATSITATSPVGVAGMADITVTSATGTSSTSAADQFTYAKAMQSVAFTSIKPTNPPIGSTYTPVVVGGAGTAPVVISVSDLCSLSGGVVTFNAAGFCVISANQASDANYDAAAQVQQVITVPPPANAPKLTSIAPTTGLPSGGTLVTLTGTGFTGATSVTFDGAPLAAFTFVNDTSITITTPAGAAGSKANVQVVTPAGSNADNALFQYVKGAQVVVFTSNAPTSPVVGGTYTPTATGGAGSAPVVLSASGTCSLAGGVVTFNSAGSCLINADQAGDANYLAAAQVQQSITVQVAPPNAGPKITSANAASFNVGTASSFTVTTTGYPFPVFYKSGALPTGVTFVGNHDGTATIAGTPAPGSGGTYKFEIVAYNLVNTYSDDRQIFTLTVKETPTISSANSTTFYTNAYKSFAVTTTGGVTSGLTMSGTLPPGLTFTNANNGIGVIQGAVGLSAVGTYPLTFLASNGILPDATQNFTLYVTAPPAPAITSVSPASGPIGTSITIRGTALTGVTAVKFGNVAATAFSFVDDTWLTATAPAGTGTVDITVTTPSGISVVVAADQ
ncbi:MAG: Ig-like domain-containing protein, partial [Alphaproteobacteria bacterium]|nr:Ig-like domain-containing protein [Alphaproteobacteria bacterium]